MNIRIQGQHSRFQAPGTANGTEMHSCQSERGTQHHTKKEGTRKNTWGHTLRYTFVRRYGARKITQRQEDTHKNKRPTLSGAHTKHMLVAEPTHEQGRVTKNDTNRERLLRNGIGRFKRSHTSSARI